MFFWISASGVYLKSLKSIYRRRSSGLATICSRSCYTQMLSLLVLTISLFLFDPNLVLHLQCFPLSESIRRFLLLWLVYPFCFCFSLFSLFYSLLRDPVSFLMTMYFWSYFLLLTFCNFNYYLFIYFLLNEYFLRGLLSNYNRHFFFFSFKCFWMNYWKWWTSFKQNTNNY